MERRQASQQGLGFFGLTSNNVSDFRISVFKQIHEIVFHGNGGYDYATIYNMPIWLRKYTYSELDKYFSAKAKAEEEAIKGKNQTTLVDSSGKINTPEFLKASKPYKGKTGYK